MQWEDKNLVEITSGSGSLTGVVSSTLGAAVAVDEDQIDSTSPVSGTHRTLFPIRRIRITSGSRFVIFYFKYFYSSYKYTVGIPKDCKLGLCLFIAYFRHLLFSKPVHRQSVTPNSKGNNLFPQVNRLFG